MGKQTKQNKLSPSTCPARFRKVPVSRGVVRLASELVGLVGLDGHKGVGAVNRARGDRFRVCEDRSDVLFDLSAAEDRRLYTAGNCAGPIRCLSDADGLFQQQQALRPPYMRRLLGSTANPVIETPDTASIIVARSAPRPKSLSAAD